MCLITGLVVLVPHNEDHVETRQNGRLEVDVLNSHHELSYQGSTPVATYLSRTPALIISAKHRVRGGQHAGTRVKHGGDTSLGDGDGLLFHSFVDSDTIFVSHLVELIDTDDTRVSKNHSTTFEVEFTL